MCIYLQRLIVVLKSNLFRACSFHSAASQSDDLCILFCANAPTNRHSYTKRSTPYVDNFHSVFFFFSLFLFFLLCCAFQCILKQWSPNCPMNFCSQKKKREREESNTNEEKTFMLELYIYFVCVLAPSAHST